MIARRATRKIITRVIVFLIAGAIVNVAVAWGLGARHYSTGTTQHWLPNEDDVRWWQKHAPPGFGNEPAGTTESRRFGAFSLFMHEEQWSEDNRTTMASAELAGHSVAYTPAGDGHAYQLSVLCNGALAHRVLRCTATPQAAIEARPLPGVRVSGWIK